MVHNLEYEGKPYQKVLSLESYRGIALGALTSAVQGEITEVLVLDHWGTNDNNNNKNQILCNNYTWRDII